MHIKTIFIAVFSFLLASCVQKEPGIRTDYYTTKSGKEVVITCIKHSSIEINYDGFIIQVDPVISAYRPIIDYVDKPDADLILVTHEHYDHFDMNGVFILNKETTTLLLTPRCYGRYKRGTIVRNGDKVRIGNDIKVEVVPAYNTTKSRWQIHPKGVGNGYILNLDGFRIYIAGDTEFIPEMRNIKNIDVAFLPCDQPKTMTPAQLRQAAKAIRPRVLYPYHMGQTDTTKIKRALSGLPIDVKIRYLK